MGTPPGVNVNLDLAKPITTFIEKLAHGAGILYEPHRIKRLAKADASAALIRSQSEHILALNEIQNQAELDLARRALDRLAREEMKRQLNIEAVIEQALPLVTSEASADMDDDWLSAFFKRSGDVSEQSMQAMWAKILAGEANAPGTFSRRALDVLNSMGRDDALRFEDLSQFYIFGQVMIFHEGSPIYVDNGISYSSLVDLDSLGLISFSPVTDSVLQSDEVVREDRYGDNRVVLIPQEGRHGISIGHVVLTSVGRELIKVCSRKPVDGFLQHVHMRTLASSFEMKVFPD